MLRLTSDELFKAHPQPMWACDRDSLQFIEVNDAAVERYGYSREEFLQMTLLDIRPLEDADAFLKKICDLQGGYQEPGIWRHRLKSGRIIYAEIIAYAVEIDGRPAWLAMAQDVTQRVKVMEDERRYAEERAAVIDALPASIALLNSAGEIMAVNQEWRRFAEENRLPDDRYGEGENYLDICRRSVGDLAAGAREAADGIASVLEGRTQHFEFEYPSQSASEHRWYRMMVRPVSRQGLAGAVVMHVNITEQRAMEDRLRQAQRLEAVGQLTGGIAHDYNILLAVILGNAELLEMQLSKDEALQRLALLTKTAAERGAELTSRLLAFSTRQTLRPAATDIRDLLHRMKSLLRRTLGEHIEIEIANGEPVQAHVDSAQLENVILNLCINARDAMPGGGCLQIALGNVRLDDSSMPDPDLAPGDYALIAVSDTGVGMSPEVAKRAFEPFFTTKEVGKGSGLGLSMVFGFVKQSHGHVRLFSEPVRGTTVKLYLPRGVPASLPQRPARTGPRVPGGSETVLLVEDNDLVRNHVAGQLVRLGYRVVVARNGPEALEVLKETGSYDLLFTDIVMPAGMTGYQVAEEARRLRPQMPVLFTSGYTEKALEKPAGSLRRAALLEKPYRLQDLAVAVRKVLDEVCR